VLCWCNSKDTLVVFGIDGHPLVICPKSEDESARFLEGNVYIDCRGVLSRTQSVLVGEHLLAILLDHDLDRGCFRTVIDETNASNPLLCLVPPSETATHHDGNTEREEGSSIHSVSVATCAHKVLKEAKTALVFFEKTHAH
jgi:hypothetical protein